MTLFVTILVNKNSFITIKKFIKIQKIKGLIQNPFLHNNNPVILKKLLGEPLK